MKAAIPPWPGLVFVLLPSVQTRVSRLSLKMADKAAAFSDAAFLRAEQVRPWKEEDYYGIPAVCVAGAKDTLTQTPPASPSLPQPVAPPAGLHPSHPSFEGFRDGIPTRIFLHLRRSFVES